MKRSWSQFSGDSRLETFQHRLAFQRRWLFSTCSARPLIRQTMISDLRNCSKSPLQLLFGSLRWYFGWTQESMTGKRVPPPPTPPPYRPYYQAGVITLLYQVNPSQVVFRYFAVLEILAGSRTNQSRGADFAHVDSPGGFTCMNV